MARCAAVIFPTAWEFLQSLGIREEYLLGITLAGEHFPTNHYWLCPN